MTEHVFHFVGGDTNNPLCFFVSKTAKNNFLSKKMIKITEL